MSNSIGDNVEIGLEKTRRRRSPLEVLVAYSKSGRFVTDLCEEFDPLRAPLPAGYSYANPSSITIAEIARLWYLRRDGINSARTRNIKHGRAIIDVGVRNAGQKLVGKGTIIHDKQGYGQLADFIVRPQDRGRGIGKAIIDERLRIAESLGVESIYIADLMSTNTLESYYFEQGFVRLEDGGLGLGPTPVPIIL
ncbi:GNAT family N-acetyltransferase [Candidatus Saccharibacteria bacterium]|jgi:GNAT superfamily N-acetyltransferase|nr:GNAT family N-acetyltransferase [Candidatus Saccharibacteria bacterium]